MDRPLDKDRIAAVQDSLRRSGLVGLVCALPKHVLLLTGSASILGRSIALVTVDGWVGLVAPKDEKPFASVSWASQTWFYGPESAYDNRSMVEMLRSPLTEAIRAGGFGAGPIGIETSPTYVPSPYVSVVVFHDALPRLISEAVPDLNLRPADQELDAVLAIKTAGEIDRIGEACQIAAAAFAQAGRLLAPNCTELEVAARLELDMAMAGENRPNVLRAEAHAFCMSGPNAAEAGAAYQWSRARAIREGDLALLHVNASADGFWNDVSRTLPVGEPSAQAKTVLRTIVNARQAALEAIRPGARASDADLAARRVLEKAGFGNNFTHPLGHGVGFDAIDHAAKPLVSPTSDDRFAPGMVFNVEPAVYLPGVLGARHCDLVTVTQEGCQVLTPFLPMEA